MPLPLQFDIKKCLTLESLSIELMTDKLAQQCFSPYYHAKTIVLRFVKVGFTSYTQSV